jgi:cell division protein FtsA
MSTKNSQNDKIPKSTEVVVGLDIGTTKIACFVGIKNEHNKIQIITMGQSESLGVMRGVVSNISQTVESINTAVQEACDHYDGRMDIGGVYVGIAGQHIKSYKHRGIYTRPNAMDEITAADLQALEDDMHRLVVSPGEEIIHVLPQEYHVDGSQGIKNPIGMPGARLEASFHIITGHVNAAVNINRSVDKAGLVVENMILEPLASAAAVLSNEEKEAGVVLVDIGGGTTDVAIFHEGIIRHTAVIPFGGNIITEDIKQGCNIMHKYAEKIKTSYGMALAAECKANEVVCIPGIRGREDKTISLRMLASIIQARMEEIIECVNEEIKASGYGKKLFAGLVVTGGGSQLKHVRQLFEFTTGLDTRIGLPTEHLAAEQSNDMLSSPIYATGIGLVMMGFEQIEKENAMNGIGATPQLFDEPKKDKQNKPKMGDFFNKIKTMSRGFFDDPED